jgi:hypothetical protein
MIFFYYIIHAIIKNQITYYISLSKHNKMYNENGGYDVQEDLVAGKLGIKTFLIRDNIIHRTDEQIYADYIGYYDDFLNFA